MPEDTAVADSGGSWTDVLLKGGGKLLDTYLEKERIDSYQSLNNMPVGSDNTRQYSGATGQRGVVGTTPSLGGLNPIWIGVALAAVLGVVLIVRR